jgi:hypothetical protein
MVVALVVTAVPAQAAPGDQQCRVASLAALQQAPGAANLGCATSAPFTTAASTQPFEHGRMLWLQEWGSITVFLDGGSYESHTDQFSAGEPELMGLVPPSAELLEPKQGFGEVWRKLGGPTAPVGWASAGEESYVATVQYFERGAVIQRGDGDLYILAIFNHARGQWTKIGSQ